jgi:peptidoglycan/LPS O-acetylase OafA/YrhL
MPRPTQPALQHISQIDGLRALAILMVFVHHAFGVPQLWAGVDLFFILSGFLITGILVRDADQFSFGQLAKRFYFRRAQRILPAYCLFMLAAVPLVHIPWRHLWPWYAFFAQNVPVAFNWISLGVLNPLWSLGVENQFYLVWPLVVFFLPRKWLAPAMVALLVGDPLLRFFATAHSQDNAMIYALTPFRLDSLAAGALLALVLPAVKPAQAAQARRAAQTALAVATVVLLVATVHYPWFRRAYNAPSYNAFIFTLNLLILGGLFVWAWFSSGALAKCLSHPVLGWLGRISYMFYLSHLFFLYYASLLVGLDHKLPHSAARPISVALGFALTCAFSTLSWKFIEQPALNYRRKQTPTRQEIANAQAAA